LRRDRTPRGGGRGSVRRSARGAVGCGGVSFAGRGRDLLAASPRLSGRGRLLHVGGQGGGVACFRGKAGIRLAQGAFLGRPSPFLSSAPCETRRGVSARRSSRRDIRGTGSLDRTAPRGSISPRHGLLERWRRKGAVPSPGPGLCRVLRGTPRPKAGTNRFLRADGGRGPPGNDRAGEAHPAGPFRGGTSAGSKQASFRERTREGLLLRGGADGLETELRHLGRGPQMVLRNPSVWVPREYAMHHQWFHVQMERSGDQVVCRFEGREILRYADPEPLSEGRVGLWTRNSGISVPRATIYFQRRKTQGGGPS